MPMRPRSESPHAPRLSSVASVFTRYANLTFGGGSATIAILRDQLVARRRWISEFQFQLAYALSRLTPGTNLLAFCTAVGWFSRRWVGALVALAAASLPCSILAVLATRFYEVWQSNSIFHSALRGAFAAAIAVMLNTAWVLAAPHVKAAPAKALVIIPTAVVLVTLAPVSPFQVLLLAAVGGLLWPARGDAE
ncbi:chromate transporter [Pendulispora albinea]|uniref:Chromate transporter n=1 Tax=Pendulispora albinea TaxID=2741071 RepID=A0ABZ2MB79_9BACT